MQKKTFIICITSGDIDGIGLEVSLKALLKLTPRKDVRWVLFLKAPLCGNDEALLKRVKERYTTKNFSCLKEALIEPLCQENLFLIHKTQPSALWVEEVAEVSMVNPYLALCTGPLSKPGIQEAGLKDIGHTEILRRISKTNITYMAFMGRHFRVLCATGHSPLEKVPSLLTKANITAALDEACRFQQRLLIPSQRHHPPVGVLGLNPHAGDQGLIGDFEDKILRPIIQEESQKGRSIVGPLIPDVAFQKANWKKYSLYVALYHDQGLIPFKLVHGFNSGVHITLGLPFVRTSVDHGTAKDIYGLGTAHCGSMLDAIGWALRLLRLKEGEFSHV